MKRICLLICATLPLLGIAQSTFMTEGNATMSDINGNPIRPRSEYSIEGTPYFNDNYCSANIKVQKGKLYKGMLAKIDLQENRLIYKTPDGAELEANVNIESIDFDGCPGMASAASFRSGYPAVDKQSEKSLYQVLDAGNVQLLKFSKVTYKDEKPYSSASTIRTYTASHVYYAYSGDKGMINLGKGDETAILKAFEDKKADMSKYITAQNLRLKKEEDLLRLFNYYNQNK